MPRARSAATLLISIWLGIGFGLGTGCAADDDAAQASDSDPDGDDSDPDGGDGDPVAIGDHCEDTTATMLAPSRLEASLRHATPDPEFEGIASSCGLTGPTVFVKAKLEARGDLSVVARGRDYSARVAVLLPGCTVDPDRILACGETLPVTIRDVGPSTDILIAVGIDADDPALAEPIPEHALDPLDFELRLDVRAVLGEHALCGPSRGRCEAGTVCLPEDESGVIIDRCRRPPADSCVAPGTLMLASPGAVTTIEIPPDEPHSDAHEHGCTGWRRPERVEQLELPAGLGETATLEIHADDPRVGLALRGSSCLIEDAFACAPAILADPDDPDDPGSSTTSLSFGAPGQLAALAAAGESPLLFIELRNLEVAPDDDPAVVHVSVELIE